VWRRQQRVQKILHTLPVQAQRHIMASYGRVGAR
jgi:hypothetical protein